MNRSYTNIKKEAKEFNIDLFHFRRILRKKGGTAEMVAKGKEELLHEIILKKESLKQNLPQNKGICKRERTLKQKQSIYTFVNDTNKNKLWVKYTNRVTGKELYKAFKANNRLVVKYNNTGELFINI